MIPPDRAPPDCTQVEPALVARFRHDVARLRPVVTGERIALAVSGGPDSMALLTLAAAAYPGQVMAATVDHGLRAASAGEAAMVAGHAASIGVPHGILRIAEPPGPRDNVQAWARGWRYDLLARWAIGAGATCLATAHHADDQAETFLMRAARGSGVAGLAGIRAIQRSTAASPVALIRPLLYWRVAELRALVTGLGVPFVDDPSNVDPRYDRARIRALLRDAPWLDAPQIARSAGYLAEVDCALREIEAWVWATRRLPPHRHPGPVPGSTGPHDHQPQDVHHGGPRHEAGVTEGEGATEAAIIRLDVADLPRELKRRLTRTALHAVRAAAAITRPAFTDSTNIEPLLDALEAGKSATQAGVIASVKGNVWRFAEQPPRRTA